MKTAVNDILIVDQQRPFVQPSQVLKFRFLKNRETDPMMLHMAQVEWTFMLSPEEREATRQEWLLDCIADLAIGEDA